MALLNRILELEKGIIFWLLCGFTAIFFTIRFVGSSATSPPADCNPAPQYPYQGFLGFGFISRFKKAKQNHSLPATFCNLFDETGEDINTVRVNVLGKSIHWTRDPENIKTILSSKFSHWELPAPRKATFRICLGGGIFGTDGPEWEHSRAALKPSFNRSQMRDTQTLAKHADNLISRIPDGELIDLADLFPLFTMDVGTEMLFGESVGSLEPAKAQEAKEFTAAFDHIVKTMSKHMTLPITTKLPDPELRRSVKFVDKFATEVIDRTVHNEKRSEAEINQLGDKYVFPTELAKIGMPSEKIKIEVINIMVAGRDTTAALLSVLWWYLARRPDIVKKLRGELEYLAGQPPSGSDLKRLVYLKSVINESMITLL